MNTGMGDNKADEILSFLQCQVNENVEAVKRLSSSQLNSAWDIVKQLKHILHKPECTDPSPPKRKRGRPRKQPNVRPPVPDAEKTVGQGLKSDLHGENVEQEESRGEGHQSTGEHLKAAETSLSQRPRRKAAGRLQEFLRTLKKDAKNESDDEDESSNVTPNLCSDREGKENISSENTLPVGYNLADKPSTANTATDDSVKSTDMLDPTLLEVSVTGSQLCAENDDEARLEKIPVRGPTKLSQAELAFFEECRMADGLGWKCPTCMKILNNRANLKVHMRIHTGEKPFSCQICGKKFSVKVNYKRHLEIHLVAFKCQMCDEVFQKKEDLVSHKMEEHSDEMSKYSDRKPLFECHVCGVCFQFKIEMLRHLKSTHSVDHPYECGECDAKFGDEAALTDHTDSVHTVKDTASPGLPEVDAAEKDQINAAEEPDQNEAPLHPFECEICHKVLSGRGSYMNHRLTHEKGRKFHCQYCPATYRWRVNLKAHERMHTEERPYVCRQPGCGKAFTTASILKRHKNSHDTVKKFKCDECDKLFSYSLTLKRHIAASHRHEKTECDICHEKFAYSSNLWRHIKYNHRDKTFQCDKCDKMFAIKYDLKKHMGVHDNTCTYKCPICSKTFKRSDFLTRHFQQHKGIPTFPCRKCKEKFVTRAERDQHQKSCGTGVLIQMGAGVCQGLDLQDEALAGVKQLIVNPNLVQGVEDAQAVMAGMAAGGLPVGVLTEGVGGLVEGDVEAVIPAGGLRLEAAGEPGQTIILLVNSDQDGVGEAVLEGGVLQQQALGDPNTYQIIQTYVDEGRAQQGGSIPAGYEVVLESNYPITEAQ